MPPLEELKNNGDVLQNWAKSAEEESKLDVGNVLSEFLRVSAVTSKRSAFQREMNIQREI